MNNSNHDTAVLAGIGIIAIFAVLAVALVFHIFFSFCFKRICEKCGLKPGILIWIPILNFIPLLQAAGMSAWLILLFLIPPVGFIVTIIMWVKICTIRRKNPLLVIGVILLSIFFIPYLAFSD